MGVGLNSMNQITGGIAAAGAAAAAIGDMAAKQKMADAAQLEKDKAAEEAKKVKSYEQDLNKILGEETINYPEFKDPEMFNKALDMMEGKRSMMLAQREAVRSFRNQYVKGSEEYNLIESEGQERRQANFNDFRESLRQLRKGGKNGR